MPSDIIPSFTASSYQYLDGSNTTLMGIDEKISGKRGSAGTFLGVSTDFKKNASLIIDFKGSHNYDDKGVLGQNLRIRNNIGNNGSSTQIRYSPLTLNVPVGKNTTAYLNPHYSGKINYKTDKWDNSFGAFGGVTQKLNKDTSLSLEIQRYNLQDIKDNSAKNWSANAVISYKF